MKFKLSPRLALILIAAMFFMPLAAAWLMYSGNVDYQPASTRNLGQLVQPPVPAPLDELQPADASGEPLRVLEEHWVIVRPLPTGCAGPCLESVTQLRQVHRAAGRNQSRISILLLLEGTADSGLKKDIEAIYPSFILATDPAGTFSLQLQKVAAAAQPGSIAQGNTYLMDPLGNIMLFYGADSDPNDLKKDLKRLLTWSKLDEQS